MVVLAYRCVIVDGKIDDKYCVTTYVVRDELIPRKGVKVVVGGYADVYRYVFYTPVRVGEVWLHSEDEFDLSKYEKVSYVLVDELDATPFLKYVGRVVSGVIEKHPRWVEHVLKLAYKIASGMRESKCVVAGEDGYVLFLDNSIIATRLFYGMVSDGRVITFEPLEPSEYSVTYDLTHSLLFCR